jgi:hypothetical protein
MPNPYWNMTVSQPFDPRDEGCVTLLLPVTDTLSTVRYSLELGDLVVWTKPGYIHATRKILSHLHFERDPMRLFASFEVFVCNFAAVLTMPTQIVLARDLIGSIPLFLAQYGKRFVVSTSLEQIRSEVRSDVLSRDYLETFLASDRGHHPQWSLTPWHNIQRVRPNHMVTIHAQGIRTQPYSSVPQFRGYGDVHELGMRL